MAAEASLAARTQALQDALSEEKAERVQVEREAERLRKIAARAEAQAAGLRKKLRRSLLADSAAWTCVHAGTRARVYACTCVRVRVRYLLLQMLFFVANVTCCNSLHMSHFVDSSSIR